MLQKSFNGSLIRALLIVLIMTFLGALWVKQVELLVSSTKVSESVPPIPAIAAILLILRSLFIGFPLNPLGYAISTSYGSVIWNSFFIIWLAKVIITRFGGMKLYRESIPFFLGLALGHFIVAGAIWGFLGAVWKEGIGVYNVVFG